MECRPHSVCARAHCYCVNTETTELLHTSTTLLCTSTSATSTLLSISTTWLLLESRELVFIKKCSKACDCIIHTNSCVYYCIWRARQVLTGEFGLKTLFCCAYLYLFCMSCICHTLRRTLERPRQENTDMPMPQANCHDKNFVCTCDKNFRCNRAIYQCKNVTSTAYNSLTLTPV